MRRGSGGSGCSWRLQCGAHEEALVAISREAHEGDEVWVAEHTQDTHLARAPEGVQDLGILGLQMSEEGSSCLWGIQGLLLEPPKSATFGPKHSKP